MSKRFQTVMNKIVSIRPHKLLYALSLVLPAAKIRSEDYGRSMMSRKVLLPILWTTWLSNFSSRMMFTAIMPALQTSMRLSNEAVGLLVGALSLGYAAMSYPSSLMSGRLQEKWIIFGGVAITTVSLLAFSISESLVSLLIFAFAAGAGFATYPPQGLSLLYREYPSQRLGLVMGLHETAAPIGQMVGPLFVWFAISTLGWSGCLQAWSGFSLIVGVLIMIFVPRSDRTVGSSHKMAPRPTRFSLFFVMIIVQSAVWSCNLGLLSMIPVYLTKTFLLDVSYVAFILGISRITGAAGQIGGGYLSDRLGRTRILLLLTAMIFTATLWITLIPFNTIYIVGLFFQGLVGSAFFPVYFATISDIADDSSRARMIGLTNSISAFIGGTIAPAIIGGLSDRFTFQVAFSFPIVMGIVGCLGAIYVWKHKPATRA
ncbi:MAG: MFS transporter [archaeon]